MMSEGKGSLISTSASSSSSSRLSPLAPPFTIKTSGGYENANPLLACSHKGSAFGTSHPFSQPSLDAYPHHLYHSDATSISVFPFRDFDPISDFHGSMVDDYSLHTDFTGHADVSSQTSIQNGLWNLGNLACGIGLGDGKCYGVEDQHEQKNMFLSKGKDSGLPMSGYTLPKKGLLALETPTTLHGTGNLAMAAYNPIRSKDTDRMCSKSSCPPFNSKANTVSNSTEGSFSATCHDAQGSLSYSNPAVNWSYRDLNFIPKESYSKHMDFCGTKPTPSGAPQYYSSPALGLSGISTKASLFGPVSAVNMDSCSSGAANNHYMYEGSTIQANVLLSGKHSIPYHGLTRIPVCNEVGNPSSRESSELQVAVTSVINELALEPQDFKTAVTLDKPSTLDNHNDSDLDSPCWKGKQAYHSPFQESESLKSQVSQHETVARNSLNPLAPHFFPVKAKQKPDECHNACQGCNSFSFQKTADLAAVVSSRKKMMSPVRTGTCQTDGNNLTRTWMNNTGDMVHDRLDTCLCLHVTESLNSPSSGVDIFSCFAERSEGLSTSKSNIDTESMIKVMLDLSNFLLLNCSNVNIFNESEHDKVQNIINNLYVYTRNRAAACRFPTSDSGHLSSSYDTMLSADYYKEMLNSISQSSNDRLESGGDNTTEMARKGNTGVEEKMHPEALMYRKLWLETVSALSFLKKQSMILICGSSKPELDE